ncbi:MAG: hypothetical protein AAF384_02385 [Pseudomonadota bacterium]
MAIEITDLKLDYVSLAKAREMSGLRIVLGAYPIPGPWREACKGVFHVKDLTYVRAHTADHGENDLAFRMGGTQSELIAWSGQASAPVVAWNDELPKSSWIAQLNLAERLNPEPPLIPRNIADRILMFGLANELLGEQGLVWNKRHLMAIGPLATLPANDPQRSVWQHLGGKYGYSKNAADRAPGRIVDILTSLHEQLVSQQAKNRRYLLGESLSALDIYWSTTCNFLAPMPPERCPMADAFRGPYGNDDPLIEKALSGELKAHRDFIYEQHLELPIVF